MLTRVDAQRQRVVRRVEIEAYDVAHLVDEQRVARQLEGLRALRLQPEGAPDAVPIIPDRSTTKTPHAFRRDLYRLCNRVERFFNKLKRFRRIATPYEKLAASYLAMIKIATIRIWLRANESTD